MARELDVTRLRMLREVSVRGSIAAAARHVGLTASAVSQQLSALERETGTALLLRSARGVQLTPAGVLLSEHAERVLAQLAEADADLDRLAGSVSGVVRVASVASVAGTVVSAAARRLRHSAPNVAVHVVAAEPESGIGLLLRNDVELAVVDEYDLVPVALPASAIVRELGVEPLVVLAATGARRVSGELGSLRDAAWVMPPADAACGRAVRAACRIAGFEPDVRWESDDMALLIAAAAAGHGICVLPRRCLLTVGAIREPGQCAVTDEADGAVVPPGLSSTVLRRPALTRRIRLVLRSDVATRPGVAAVAAAIEDVAAGR